MAVFISYPVPILNAHIYSGIHPQADTGPEVFALIWASRIDIGYEESKVTEKSERGGRPLVAPWSGPW